MKRHIEKLKSTEAIFFDLDGTLMDTDDQAVARLSKWMKRLGLSRPVQLSRRLVMALETPLNTVMTGLDLLGLDGLVHRIQEIKPGRREKGRRFLPVQGLGELVAQLSSRFVLAVVTTRSRKDTDIFLEENSLDGRFHAVVTRESTWRIKPHPAPLLKAAEMCSVPVGRCLMVGDTVLDIRAANRAGVLSAAVLCGFGKKDELYRAGADVILDHTKELLKIFGL
jgi:phosphoglycolate phosphatase-like HAD superfamily hydrolase